MVWLKDKILSRQSRKIKVYELFTRSDHGIGLSKRNPSLSEEFLGLEFIISEADCFSRILFFDILEISGVHTKDSKIEHTIVGEE
jgi:hypothetical protein